MKRRKLFNLRRIALALAVAAIVPAAAQAKPTPAPNYELGPGEIPYLSQGAASVLSTSQGATPRRRRSGS